MAAPDFCHLHVHSEYSLLDGANRISDLVKACQQDGQRALALTDHGNMYGAIELYQKATKGGIKPLLGCEYTAESIDRLCEALRSVQCELTTLKLTKCQMRTEEARKLAAAVKVCSVNGPMMQTLVLEGSSLPVPQLLGIRELSQGLHKRLSTECSKLHASEVTLIAKLLAENTHLETLDFNSSSLSGGLSKISHAISQRAMPLCTRRARR